MKDEAAVRRRLARLEEELTAQAAECREKGWGTAASNYWDKRCVERALLRWLLGLRKKAFNAADTLAGI